MNAIAKDIYEAAVYGDVGVVKRLLKSATFADLIYKNPNDLHKTAVMVAAYHGHTEIVRAIFKHSIASVHMQDEEGWTALMFAAYRGHTSTINAILLHPEVDINVKNNHGYTALMLAASQGHATSVRALLTRADIDVNVQNNQDGGTALLLAAMKGYTEIVRDILSLKGVLVNLEDKEGRIPVFAAKNDEITALINFYDPVLGLVYPVPDLPPPPRHTVALMPPLPPAHEPRLALSAEFTQCEEEVQALVVLLDSIRERGAWHQQRVALQHQMETAVHIHHHKEAALIGREFLAFKATTASTAALRALSEQDYLHLTEKVTLLQQRLSALCSKLTQVEDYDSLKKAEELVASVNEVQKVLAESALPPSTKAQSSTPRPPPPLPHPSSPTAASRTPRASSPEAAHAKVHFSELAVATESVLDVTGSGGVNGADHMVKVHEASEHGSYVGGDTVMPPPPPPHNTPAHVGKKNTHISAVTGVDVGANGGGDVGSPNKGSAEDSVHLIHHSRAEITADNTHINASTSAKSSPKHSKPSVHSVTATISADPELHYLPHYSAYTNTVPSGAFELHTVKKSFEELMEEKNKLTHPGASDGENVNAEFDGLLPPPPPSV